MGRVFCLRAYLLSGVTQAGDCLPWGCRAVFLAAWWEISDELNFRAQDGSAGTFFGRISQLGICSHLFIPAFPSMLARPPGSSLVRVLSSNLHLSSDSRGIQNTITIRMPDPETHSCLLENKNQPIGQQWQLGSHWRKWL